VLGACLAAAIFSNIAKLIEKLDAAGSRYTREIDKIDEFGRFFKLDRATRAKLHAYVQFKFAVSRGFDVGEATASLPPTMQDEVFFKVHAAVLRRVPMFADTDDIFIKKLVRVLRPQVLLPPPPSVPLGASSRPCRCLCPSLGEQVLLKGRLLGGVPLPSQWCAPSPLQVLLKGDFAFKFNEPVR